MGGINPVGTWQDANFEAQSGTVYKTAIDNCLAVAKRIVDNFAPHAKSTPDMNVLVDAGFVFVNQAFVDKTQQTVGPFTAPVSNPRIDRIVIDRVTGVATIVAGSEAASPTAPAIPNGKDPCCQIALATSTTAITNALITDERLGAGGNAMRVLNKVPADGTASGNDTTERISYSYTVPAGTLGTDGKINLFFRVQVRNHASGGKYCTIRIKYGGTTILSWTYNGGDGSYGILTIAAFLMADNGVSAQIASAMRVQYSAGAFTGTTEIGTAAVNSAADQALIVTLQWDGAGGANQNAFVEWANLVLET